MSENRLTAKQEKFVENYLSGGNATQAAGDAGYRHPNKRGPENVVKSGIQERIAERMQEARIHTDEVIGTLVSHLRADLGDILPDNPIVKQAKAVGLSHLIRKLVVRHSEVDG